MKTSKLKYVLVASLAAIGITAVSVYSCEKEMISPNSITTAESEGMASDLRLTTAEPGDFCGAITEKYLITDEGQKVGKAFIYNDAKNMFVTLMTIRGYYMGAANAHVASDPNDFPMNDDKNPAVNQFEYRINASGLTNVRKFVIPSKDVNDKNYVAVCAAVRMLKSSEEKSLNVKPELPANSSWIWIEGRTFGQGHVGRMFKFDLTTCELPVGNTVSDPKGITEAGDEHQVKDPKGVTSLGEGHNTTDPKKPR